jgi:hypothetical protein
VGGGGGGEAMMAGEGKNIIDVFIENIMESLSRLRLEKMVGPAACVIADI